MYKRQLILQSHYRSPIDFSDDALTAAQSGYDKISDTVKGLRKRIETAPQGSIDENVTKQIAELKSKFEAAMNEDLNTAVALSVIFELVRLTNTLLNDDKTSSKTLGALDELFTKLGGEVLGIVKDQYDFEAATDEQLLDHLIQAMIQQRQKARANKDFAAADGIRDKLAELGIILEDKPDGTTWRRK